MLAAVLILVIVFFTAFFVPNYGNDTSEEDDTINKAPQVKKLWSLAQSAMRERKPLKAEKALLTILKFDEKNAAAYNRLGILYAKEKHYKEAIECFEIAQSLDNNASSLHNVGLIYLETGKYEKAAMAFRQAIELEGDQPGRYIAYAKALEKIGERHKAAEALETAYSLNPTTVVLRHLLELYENFGDLENIELTRKRIDELQLAREKTVAKESKPKRRLIRRAPKTDSQKTSNKDPKSVSTPARQTAKTNRTVAKGVKKVVKKRKII